ncbi:MAG: hypothetical protein AAGF07_04160 [Patescibacteria group bacterium]
MKSLFISLTFLVATLTPIIVSAQTDKIFCSFQNGRQFEKLSIHNDYCKQLYKEIKLIGVISEKYSSKNKYIKYVNNVQQLHENSQQLVSGTAFVSYNNVVIEWDLVSKFEQKTTSLLIYVDTGSFIVSFNDKVVEILKFNTRKKQTFGASINLSKKDVRFWKNQDANNIYVLDKILEYLNSQM